MINLFLYWLNTLILSLIWKWSQKMKLKNCDWNVLLLVIMSIVEELCRKGLSELLKPFVFAVTCKYMYIYLPFCFTTVLTKCQVCNEQHVSTCLCQTLKLCLFTISAISTEKKHICCHPFDGVVILQTSAVHIKIYSLINLIVLNGPEMTSKHWRDTIVLAITSERWNPPALLFPLLWI